VKTKTIQIKVLRQDPSSGQEPAYQQYTIESYPGMSVLEALQTVYGKVPWGVSKMAKKHGLPVLAFAGWLDPQAEVVHQHGIDAILGILPHPMDLSEAMAGVGGYLQRAAAQAMRLLVVGMNLSDKM